MRHPNVNFVAVSHSNQDSTERWLEAVGGAGTLKVIVDSDRILYAAWGLGVSSFWHVLNPWSLKAVFTLGKQEGIWNRPTESGSRWQTSGSFGVDSEGIVVWGGPSKTSDDIPDFEQAVEAVTNGGVAMKSRL